MYEDYMQNFLSFPLNGYRNTYDQMQENLQYYNVNPYVQNRENMQVNELEEGYPEIYKRVYPMVKKVCLQNKNKFFNKEIVDNMVEEVYNNIEANDAIELNITINNDVRGNSKEKNDHEGDTRQIRRNMGLNDLIKILILRELIGKTDCIGLNCNQGPRPQRPPRQGVWPYMY